MDGLSDVAGTRGIVGTPCAEYTENGKKGRVASREESDVCAEAPGGAANVARLRLQPEIEMVRERTH